MCFCSPLTWIVRSLSVRSYLAANVFPCSFPLGCYCISTSLWKPSFWGTQCIMETVPFCLQKYTFNYTKLSQKLLVLQSLPVPNTVANLGAGAQLSWIHGFSLQATPCPWLENRVSSHCWVQLQPPPFSALIFYRSKQDRGCSSAVLLPLSPPSATTGIRKGRGCWGWWDEACLKSLCSAQAVLCLHFSLCLLLVSPFILLCSYRAKCENITYWIDITGPVKCSRGSIK